MGRPVLEWACAAVGALLLAGTLGMVAAQAWGHDDGAPAELRVDTEAPVRQGARHLVRFTVSNISGTTAAGVEVEGVLLQGGQAEAGRVVFDYVPRRSSVRGGLWFGADPAAGTLTVRVTGYREP